MKSRGSIPGKGKNSSLRYSVQTGHVAHPVCWPSGALNSFTGSKMASTWTWSLNPPSPEVKNEWSYNSVWPLPTEVSNSMWKYNIKVNFQREAVTIEMDVNGSSSLSSLAVVGFGISSVET